MKKLHPRFLSSPATVAVATILLLVPVGCTTSGRTVSAPIATPVAPDDPRPQTDRLTDEALLSVDPAVRVDTLANGLRTYVRANHRPAGRAELRLVVNAGSILEEDDQRGLAHVVEHMAFNRTRRFERQALVAYLESIGTRFGPDLIADPSFDVSVYHLEVRTDTAEQLVTGLEVLREWADRLSLDEEEIEKERGVVVEEWRLRRGAYARVRDAQLPVLLSGSRYAERLPIGTPESIRAFDPERLREFYRSWYRPDLMAVIAVGDFGADSVALSVRTLFEDFPPQPGAAERPTYDVPGHQESLVSIVSDPELPYGSVELVFKRRREPRSSIQDYRRSLASALYAAMFNARLGELTQSTDPPFTAAFTGAEGFGRNAVFYSLEAIVRDGAYDRAAGTLVAEAERVRRFGFTDGELQRAKADLIRAFEKAYAERDRMESASFAGEYVSHFLQDDPIPGIEAEVELARALVPALELDEVNALVNRYLAEENRVILVSGPESDEPRFPTEASLRALLGTMGDLDLAPYIDRALDAPLIDAEPQPGFIAEETHLEAIDLTTLRLSNGIRVLLKPTDYKRDEVIFGAHSPGGTSLVPDSLYIAAVTASSLIGQSGVGAFGPIELDKRLAGRIVRVGPSIGSLSEGFSGSSSSADLETLFELIYLYGVAPRADSVAYESYRKRLTSLIATSKTDPGSAFADTIRVTMSRGHFRARPTTESMVAEMDLHKSFEIYRDRFADFSDFTFTFVGAFDIEQIKELSKRYLATLPASGRVERWNDVGLRPPEGDVSRTVERGIEPKSQVRLFYTGKAEWSMDARRSLSALTDAFEIRLREVLREDLGGTYGVGVSGSLTREPYESYQIGISFGCDPGRVEELMETVRVQVDSLMHFGLSESYVTKVREASLRAQETALKQNGYWLSTLSLFDRNNLDPLTIETGLRTFMQRLTTEHLRETALRYFGTPNVARFVLRPEQ